MKKTLQNVAIILLIFVLGAGCGYVYREQELEKKAEVVENSSVGMDLQLPGEVEKRIVTVNEVEAKLVEIGQLATYSGEYTVSKSVEASRYLVGDLAILGTKNTISIECDGVVKVGYNISDITPEVDNDRQIIYIALPEPTVLDNYVIWDSVNCAEENSILNPIEFSQYQALIQEIEEDGLAKAEDQGIYRAAEKNLKLIVINFLSKFEDYSIEFL